MIIPTTPTPLFNITSIPYSKIPVSVRSFFPYPYCIFNTTGICTSNSTSGVLINYMDELEELEMVRDLVTVYYPYARRFPDSELVVKMRDYLVSIGCELDVDPSE